MVSGFFTSPCDHCRIFSGLASEMRIALNESGSLGFSKKLKISFTSAPPNLLQPSSRNPRSPNPSPSRRFRGPRPSAAVLRRRGSLLRRCNDALLGRGLHQLDVEAERLQLLDEHVERLGE